MSRTSVWSNPSQDQNVLCDGPKANIRIQGATGQISKHDAAVQMAAAHTKDYTDALAALKDEYAQVASDHASGAIILTSRRNSAPLRSTTKARPCRASAQFRSWTTRTLNPAHPSQVRLRML